MKNLRRCLGVLGAALTAAACGGGAGGTAPTLVIPEPPTVTPETPLEITITDAHGSPCSGTEVLASPVTPLDSAPQQLTMRLTVRQRMDAARVWLEWEGPYNIDRQPPVFEMTVVEWRIESSADSIDQSMDLEWHESNVVRLRFRSPDGACEGEPTVVCNDAGCELSR